MTRPNILRADTLDLQDQANPTAADHTKHLEPTAAGNAPHLAAQVNHVLEERHSEEQALADAWNTADNLTGEPSAIEPAQTSNGLGHVSNVSSHDNQDGGGDGLESETDADDDMMDRISSSPSIDDGAYNLRSLLPAAAARNRPWPQRSSSFSPRCSPTLPCESFNQTADTPSPASSPFSQTPLHLPLRARSAEMESSPLARYSSCASSLNDEMHQNSPFQPARRSSSSSFTSKHHRMGRYDQDQEPRNARNNHGHEDDDDKQRDEDSKCRQASKPESAGKKDVKGSKRPNKSSFRKHAFTRSLTNIAQPFLGLSPSLSSINSVDLDCLLLPVDDPLLDRPVSSSGSVDSWTSDMSEDSFMLSDAGNPRSSLDGDEDDADDAFLDLDDRFIDSGWGGECLRDTEDIDFEFVYALHTFVATVEGQANATKGDTMVLLDDSNSYWWLVRVVKDSSIGYLPAEHIETPTERLARLNKHRNIDLSATMLSDNSEKSRNPLKKAMRRRNAKTVQFAAPTYVEASDYEYSTEDEESQMIDPYASAMQPSKTVQDEPEVAQEETKPEVKEPHAENRSSTSSQRASFDREQAATAAQALAAAGVNGDDDQTAPKLVDKTGEFDHFGVDHNSTVPTVSTEAAPLKSKRNRNTDSFLKDDSIETRKITLTPGLLRDESKSSTDTPRSDSLESLAKTVSPVEQPKKEVKDKKKESRKEPKKGGMLSGLFKSKKKDKKAKEEAAEAGDPDKLSWDGQRDSPRASPSTSGKTSPVDRSPIGPQTVGNFQPGVSADEQSRSKEPNKGFVAELEGSEVAHEMATGQEDGISNLPPRIDTEVASQEKSKSSNPLSPITTPITNMLKTGDGHEKPKKAKRSKQRVELDDFDTPPDEARNPLDQVEGGATGERLSESPVEISSHAFMHGTDMVHIPVLGTDDEEDEEDEPESLTSSPSIIEHPAEPTEDEEDLAEDNDSTPTARSPLPVEESSKPIVLQTRGLSTDSTASASQHLLPRPSPTVSQQTWNDDSLRAWLEDGSEVRDMLVMINDKTGVTPAPANHPLMSGLFVEQRKGVEDMMGQLDGLLGNYLQRKGVRF